MTKTLHVNGADHVVDVDDDTPLLWVLRDVLHLYGTKFGCGAGLCGACTVHIDGQAQFACQTPISEVGNGRVETIEVMQDKPVGRALQQAWIETDVVQCGYCQPGQIMRAADLLARTPHPSDAQISDAMATNICRCGCYTRIHAAIRRASRALPA